ncbi:MAG: hypothetical protein IJF57_01300 [Clostridia bacterium]|nr:hypothetical protein [Clostridia bacterium]
MKNREEYIESIYKKRDEALELRKKRRSYLTCAACIAVCFLTAFFLVPKDKPKIEDEANYSLGITSDQFIITPEDFTTLPAADGTVSFVEEAEGNLRENKTTAFFGGTNTEKTENIQSCTVASSVPQQTAPSSTAKPTKTTTKKNHSENDTNKNDVVGAGDSIIDIEDVIDGLGSIKLPEFTINGNLLQGYRPEGFSGSLGSAPPKTTKASEAPDTGGDDLSDVLDAAQSYLSESELKEIDPSKTEFDIESSPLDSTTGSSSEICFVYYVFFQTDSKTIIIILDADTLDFIKREEYPIVKSTTAPHTTAYHTTTEPETTTVTQPSTENN